MNEDLITITDWVDRNPSRSVTFQYTQGRWLVKLKSHGHTFEQKFDGRWLPVHAVAAEVTKLGA